MIGTEEAWALPELPARLAVVGAGASGAEIASAFARLGSEVLLLEALERVLPTEDADISRLVERGLKRQGIGVHTSTPVADVERRRDERELLLRRGVRRGRLPRDLRRAAAPTSTGSAWRRPASSSTSAAWSQVDGAHAHHRAPACTRSATSCPARRSRTRPPTRASSPPRTSPGAPTHPIAYVDIPRATFCTPNVGSFGLTEEQAREQGYDVVVGKVPYGAVGGGTVYGDRTGLVKVVGESKYGELLGGHIVGSRATELIQELVNVRALEGGFPELARIIHGHPTLSEAVMEAGRAADGWLIHG